jgi:2-dehydro-3-deoxygluconokinase
MSRVVTFGELMLRLSTPGHQRFVQANRFDVSYGGSEANVAVTLAGFGVDTGFISSLPNNDIGQAAINELRRYGVNTTEILRNGDRMGIYFLEPGASQRPSKVIYDREHSSVNSLEPGQIDWDSIFADAEWFHWSGITPALGENLAKITENALKSAKKNGITVSCDLNYRRKLWSVEKARDVMIPLMEYVDVCIANTGAADDCLGISSDDYKENELARVLKERFNFKSVGITQRESLSASRNIWSAILLDDADCKEPTQAAEYDITIVDRVGGGDAFAGALIYGLLELSNTSDALEFATAASCLKLTVPGDFNHVSVTEVNDLIISGGSARVDR